MGVMTSGHLMTTDQCSIATLFLWAGFNRVQVDAQNTFHLSTRNFGAQDIQRREISSDDKTLVIRKPLMSQEPIVTGMPCSEHIPCKLSFMVHRQPSRGPPPGVLWYMMKLRWRYWSAYAM